MTHLRFATAVLLAAAVATACTTSGTGARSTSPTTAGTSAATSAASSTASSAPATSTVPVTSSPAGPAGCTSGQLTVTGGPPPGGGAAGHTGVLLVFTNHSTTPCTLFGYPGVDGLDASDHSIAHASRTLNGYLGGCRCSSPPTVTLAPGGTASALTEGNIGGDNCDQFSALLVTPPNTFTSTRVAQVPHSCGFTVHPVVSGSAGTAG